MPTAMPTGMPVSQSIPLHGLQLIEASAGTGKTYTIATLFVRLLLERPATVEQILVVTYTRAATAELQDRVRRRLVEALDAWSANTPPSDASLRALWEQRSPTERVNDEKRLRIALGNYDCAAIHTIHGFCQRVLNDHAFQSDTPLQPDLLMTERPLLEEVVHDFWARHTYDVERFVLDGLSMSVTLDGLQRLARDTLHQRDAKIIPAEASVEPLPSPQRFFDAKAKLAAAWRAQGADVIKLLSTWPGINGRSYGENTVAKWSGVITGYLNGCDITPPRPLELLTSAAISDCMNKNAGAPPKVPFSPEVDALFDEAGPVAAAIDHWKLSLRLALIREVRAEVDRRKREHDQLAFDDLLRQLRAALEGEQSAALIASLRAAYPVALVDEFQDTDPVQYAIFRAIYGNADGVTPDTRHGLFLIGDPKQAIYKFRGADVFAYMDAVRAAGEHKHHLRENWRSDPPLINAINAVFSRRKHPFVYDAIGFEPASPAPTARVRIDGPASSTAALCFTLPTHDDKLSADDALTLTCEQTARHIAHTLASGLRIDVSGVQRSVEPRDFAVLCRTNKQTALVQEALRKLRIPTARDGDSSVFETPTALELDRILSAVAQPDDPTLLRVALTTSIVGVDAATLLSFDDEHDATAWETWVTRFREWNELWLRRGFTPMLQRLLTQEGVHARLLTLTDGERRLTDLMHLTELLQRQASEHHTGPLSLVQWLRLLRQDEEARVEVDEAQIRLESDAHAVKLTTIHRSKGLEYPIVYCPFLWTGGKKTSSEDALVFHADTSAASLSIDVSIQKSDLHKAMNAEESLSEDTRLTYVALTRARHRCVVNWCNTSTSKNTALAHLLGRDSTAVADNSKAKEKAKQSAEDEAGVALRAAITALKDQWPDAITLEPSTLNAPAPYQSTTPTVTALSARVRLRRLPPGLRITSFSRLIERDARLDREAEEGHDHDANAEDSAPTTMQLHAKQEIALADVRAGADVGLLVHDVLEHSDFSIQARDSLRLRMQQSAPRHGIDVTTTGQLEASLMDALDTPLGPDRLSFALADIPAADRLAELEFMFPVSHSLSAHKLADVLARHDTTLTGRDYIDRLRGLGFQAFAGFLRGYIDLCFTRDGRFYVLDYKTNHLGRHVDDYASDSLQRAMGEHHYYLQALVYSVALHRHLQLRLRGYDYDQQFGGFLYLFMRGMAPSHPRGTGVLYGRPTHALMTDISRLLDGSAT